MTILPGLTTTDRRLPEAFLADLENLPVRKIALFPTCLDPLERQNLYKDLEKISGLTIPHVHIRTDMGLGELEYLEQRFHTEVFNIHPRRSSHPFHLEASGLKKKIFIENSGTVPEPEELEEFGGLCLDYSHWENGLLQQDPEYGQMADLLERFPVGCCHLSAIMRDKLSPWGGYDHHHFRTVEDLVYLGKYKNHLPPRWLSLELENPLAQQLEAKRFLETLFWT